MWNIALDIIKDHIEYMNKISISQVNLSTLRNRVTLKLALYKIFIEYTLRDFHIFGVMSDALHFTSTPISVNKCCSKVNHISKSNCVTNDANLTSKLI